MAVMVAAPSCENLAAKRQTHDPRDTGEGTLSTESAQISGSTGNPSGGHIASFVIYRTGMFSPSHPQWEQPVRDSFSRQGLMAALAIRLHSLAPGEVRLRFDLATNLTQHHGFVHAGVIGSVLDSACGWASQTLMPAGTEVLTVEYKLNLLRPATGATFEGVGVVTRPGATITFASGQLVEINDPERPIATMTATLIGARPD